MSETTDATPNIRKSLYNTFNKMLLLTTNILVSDEVSIKKELNADYKNNRLALRLERTQCLKYDKEVFQVDVTKENDVAIDEIVNKFYDYVQALQNRLGSTRSILFVNPLFNEFDGVFQGPDGVHDVEPRGDMQGSSIIKKTPNMSAAGGWRLIDKEVGKNGQALFHDAIMRSTLVPNQEYCDDTAKLVINKQAKWNTGFITNPDTVPVPSLNPSNGHLFLDPAETERMICNVPLPAVRKFEGTDFVKVFKITDNDPNTIYDSVGLYDVTLKIVAEYGCIDTLELKKTDFIEVYPKPVSDFSVSKKETDICNSLIRFQDLSQGASSFNYNFNEIDNSNQQNPTYTYLEAGAFYPYQIVTSDKGCKDTSRQLIYIIPFNVYIPNAFTPDGNKYNSEFYSVTNLVPEDWDFTIFNRWGETVYNTKNPYDKWDGNYNNKPAQTGIYIYKLNYTSCDALKTQIEISGHVSLIR